MNKADKKIVFPKLLIKHKNQSNDDVQMQLNQEDFADFFCTSLLCRLCYVT